MVALPPSTTHRLLTTLQRRQFAQFEDGDASWHVGRRAFAVGSAFVRRRHFVQPAVPIMKRLRNETREMVNIAVPDDGEVVMLAQVESREVVRAINIVGGRAPITACALGKALLATYAAEEVRSLIQRHGLPAATEHSITDAAELDTQLAHAREHGFATDVEEFLPGLHCAAAPLFDSNGDAIAALSISGIGARVATERLPELGRAVHAAATELTLLLGGAIPDTWPTQAS